VAFATAKSVFNCATPLVCVETDLAVAKATAKTLYDEANAAAQKIHDDAVSAAQTVHDQGVSALQGAVDAALAEMVAASAAKDTADSVLAAERGRLESEISTLEQVIALIEGVISINTPSEAPVSSGWVLAYDCTFCSENNGSWQQRSSQAECETRCSGEGTPFMTWKQASTNCRCDGTCNRQSKYGSCDGKVLRKA
jgi:hypothetical protein